MSIKELFSHTHHIPSIPKLVQELIDNFNSDQGHSTNVAKKIQMDPALSAKVLRIANSARYGGGRKINSIESAVVMLGYDALKTLVIASGVTAACKDIPGMDQIAFWRSAFSVANIAKLIARHAKINQEVAFTCGMLHNIGETLLFIAHTDTMKNIEKLPGKRNKKLELQQIELGYTSIEVGAELAHAWKFPDEIVCAIRYQMEPEKAESKNQYAQVINIASTLSAEFLANKTEEDIMNNFPMTKVIQLNVDLLQLFNDVFAMFEKEDEIEQFLA